MFDWVADVLSWLLDVIKGMFTALFDLLKDLALALLKLVLDAVVGLVNLLPAPDFLANNNLGTLLAGLPGFALYLIQHMNLPAALAVVGSAFLFRMARKAATLFQW
jgi:zinc transporter ZupT